MEKLRLDRQGLSRLAQKRIGELPMSTEDAHYTIAHEHGIRLSKYLSPEQVAATRHLVTQLRASAAPQPAKPPRSTAGPKSGPRRQTLVTIGGVDVERVPGLTAQHAADAKRMAESVYPMLYVFENSARDVIQGVLEARYGSEWWLQVPKKVRDKARAAEAKDPWHGSRRRREIDYVLLTELATIVRARWDDFSHLFPRESWFEELVTGDMNVPRRVLAHMHPIEADDVASIASAFRKWTNQLRAKEALLP